MIEWNPNHKFSHKSEQMSSHGGSAVKNLPAMQESQETWVWSLGWEDPLEECMTTHSSMVAWRIPMDRGTWRATVHRITKSQTGLTHRGQESEGSCLRRCSWVLFPRQCVSGSCSLVELRTQKWWPVIQACYGIPVPCGKSPGTCPMLGRFCSWSLVRVCTTLRIFLQQSKPVQYFYCSSDGAESSSFP